MLPLLHLLSHRCHFYITIRIKSPHLPVRLKLTFTQKKRTNGLKCKQARYHLACYFWCVVCVSDVLAGLVWGLIKKRFNEAGSKILKQKWSSTQQSNFLNS